ncbi:serine hydrolase [Bacillaceae bacterium SIJ1]|nr:serine hydrolase [Litoribacterium kuwaitense]
MDAENTLFRVASVSKVFTAAAVLQLVEEGALDIEDDIRLYLPGIPFENPYDEPVTIADLLAHTTGFEVRDPKQTDIQFDFEKKVSIEAYVRENMPPVLREPGTSYLYGNFASLLQGLIVQNVSGMPFETYMEEHMFQPLGMDNSTFVFDEDLVPRMATGYTGPDTPMEPYTMLPTVMPHGGLLTTASDMSLFMNAFLEGTDETHDVLSEDVIEAMIPYRQRIHETIPDTTYGFEAPFQIPFAGSSDEVITKAGDLPGYSSYLWMVPEEDIGVFVTSTQSSTLRNQLYNKFMGTFLPEFTKPLSFEDYQPTKEELMAYEGLYNDLRMKSIVHEVTVNEDETLTFKSSLLGESLLIPAAPDLFMDEATGLLVAFNRQEGYVSYMKEPFINPLGYSEKGVEPKGFRDIAEDSRFTPYILKMQSIGIYDNDPDQFFQPEKPVTRGEYIERMLHASGVPESTNPVQFTDAKGHPAAGYIQAAYELGLITGTPEGEFHPDEPIEREEAATIVWRSVGQVLPAVNVDHIQLTGEVSPWAEQPVKAMISLGYYGPEVSEENGVYNYHSERALTRQEEAVQLYKLMTEPIFH